MPDQVIVIADPIVVRIEHYADGATGDLAFRLINLDTGAPAINWATTGIVQLTAAGDGPPWIYLATRDSAGLPAGAYQAQWRLDSTPATVWLDRDDLTLVATAPVPPPAGPLSIAELKTYLGTQLPDDDVLLQAKLAAAFAVAQSAPPTGCGRLLVPDPAPGDPVVQKRFLVPARRPYVLLPDASEITEVLVDDVVVTDYDPLEHKGMVVQLTLPRSCADPAARMVVLVTGRFGFPEIPDDLRDAIYTLAAKGYYARGAMYADQVVSSDSGVVQNYFRHLPPESKATFASYVVPAAIGGLS